MSAEGNYQYKTTCLTCGWHKDCGVSFEEVHKHISECPNAVVVISVREKQSQPRWSRREHEKE